MSIEEQVEELTVKIGAANSLDIEVVDTEYVTERGERYLRIYIDKTGGVSLDDCTSLSELIGEALDKEDFIKGSYILEVSSPGLDRPLKKPRDFIREQGKEVDVNFFAPRNGKKTLTGILSSYDGENLTVAGQSIPMDEIALVRLHIDI